MKTKIVLVILIILSTITLTGNADYVAPPVQQIVKDSDLIAIVKIHKGLSEDEILKYELNSKFDCCAVGEIIETLKGKPSGKYIVINYQWQWQKPNLECLEQGRKYLLCLTGKDSTFILYFPHEGASVYGFWDGENQYIGRDIEKLRKGIDSR